MRYHPLGYSLFIHALIIGFFFSVIVFEIPKSPPKIITMKLSSILPQPTTLPAVIPKTLQKIKPLQKPQPTEKMKPDLIAPQPIKYSQNISPKQIANIPDTTPPIQSTFIAPTTTPPLEAAKIAPPPPPKINPDKVFLDAHLGEIRALLIQNLKYPKIAQKLRMQGEPQISFVLNADGSVETIEVVESSGFEILDKDAVLLIEKTAPRFPKPSESVQIRVPLSYVLH